VPCLAIYGFLAGAIYGLGNSWVSAKQIPLCACGDQAQEVWFLAWLAFVLHHGHNLFFTWWMNVPSGVNLATNTAMPLLGVVGAPITWLLGPLATYNLLLRLAFIVSAFSMCLVLRRWTTWWPSAFFGGLLYGFSAFMVGQGEGHLFLTMVPIPPLMLLMVDEIIGRRRWPARRSGVVLGLLCVVQYLISPEILVITGISIVAVVVVVAVARRHQVAAVLPRVKVAAAWAVGVAAVLLAYPVWMTVLGPQHFNGPPHALVNLTRFVGDLLGPIVPTHTQYLAPSHLAAIGSSYVHASTAENGEYLGIPLVVALIGFTIAFRKRGLVVLAAVLVAGNLVLSLGNHLIVNNHVTAVPLPFAVLLHLPLAQSILAVRFTFGVALFSSALAALGLDMARSALIRPRVGAHSPGVTRGGAPTARRWLVSTSWLVVGCLVALPLLPAFAYPSVPADIPSLFTTSAVDRIPTDSVVLTYPYTAHPQLMAMLDQAASGMHYKIVGSSAFIPGPGGVALSASKVLDPPQLQALFSAAYSGPDAGLEMALPLATTVPQIRTYLFRYDISTVIFYDVGLDPAIVRRYLTAALGPPTHIGGVTEWFDVPSRLASARPSG
jgi:hypothetical protein